MERGKDKRDTPRIKTAVTVQYRMLKTGMEGVQLTAESHADISYTKDLSEKGIFFTVSSTLPLESVMEINLKLPSEKAYLQLEGRVVSSQAIKKNIFGVGVEFINLDEQKKTALRRFIKAFLT